MLLILQLRISRSQAILSCSEEISLLCIGAPEGGKGQDFITPLRPMCSAIWLLAKALTMAALDIKPNANNCIPLRHEVTQHFLSKKSKQSKHGGSSQSRGEGHGRRRGRLVEVADHGILGGRGEAAGEAGLDHVGGDDEGAEERNIAMEEAPTDLLSCFCLRNVEFFNKHFLFRAPSSSRFLYINEVLIGPERDEQLAMSALIARAAASLEQLFSELFARLSPVSFSFILCLILVQNYLCVPAIIAFLP